MALYAKSIRRIALIGAALLFSVVASWTSIALFTSSLPIARATSQKTHAKYALVVWLDGTLPSMVTPQDAPFITSLGTTGTHFTNVETGVPADSVTDITADLSGTFPTQAGLPYETFYDRHYNQMIELDETPVLPPGFTLQTAGNLVYSETLFQAAKAAGLRTEFTSKYPAYSIENGPASLGPSPSIDVLRTPTFANFTGTPQQYDDMNFAAMRADILSGSHRPNLYAIYAVAPNTIEKQYGINAPEVAQIIRFEDKEIKQTIDAFKKAGIYDQTDIVITSDHGNTALNTAIPDSGPGSIQQYLTDHGFAVVQATADQVYLVWLKNPALTKDAIKALSSPSVKATFGIDYILNQDDLRELHSSPAYRTPDFAIQPTIGLNGTPAVVYTSPPLGKKVEHGGFNTSDIFVPLFVSGPGIKSGLTVDDHVFSMQLGTTLAYTMCLNLKTATLPPLRQALNDTNDCSTNSGQSSLALTGLPLSIPLFAVLFAFPWYLRRSAKTHLQ